MKILMSLVPLLLSIFNSKPHFNSSSSFNIDDFSDAISRQLKSIWVICVVAIFTAGILLYFGIRILQVGENYLLQYEYGALAIAITYLILLLGGLTALVSLTKSSQTVSKVDSKEAEIQTNKNSPENFMKDLLGDQTPVVDFIQGFQSGYTKKENPEQEIS